MSYNFDKFNFYAFLIVCSVMLGYILAITTMDIENKTNPFTNCRQIQGDEYLKCGPGYYITEELIRAKINFTITGDGPSESECAVTP